MTAGLDDAAAAAFSSALAQAMAGGVSGEGAVALARAGAAAAADLNASASVPVSAADALVAAINAGIDPEAVLSALGVAGGPEGAEGRAALSALTDGLARGDAAGRAFSDAGAAAGAASAHVREAGVEAGDAAAVGIASAADPSAALRALLGSMDVDTPEAAAFLAAADRALGEGRDANFASARGREAAEAARELTASAAVAADPSPLIPALAAGVNVQAIIADEIANATSGAGGLDEAFLAGALLQPLGRGDARGAASGDLVAWALAADRQVARATEDVPSPDPTLVAAARGLPSPPSERREFRATAISLSEAPPGASIPR